MSRGALGKVLKRDWRHWGYAEGRPAGVRVRVGMVRMLEDRVQVGMGMLSERTLLTSWMSNHWVRSGREVTVRELILSESVEVVGHGSLVELAAAVARSDSTRAE